MRKIIGLIFADLMEYSPFERYAEQFCAEKKTRWGNDSLQYLIKKGGREILVVAVKSGVGKVNAASAASFLISDDKADIVMNAGLSGAVSKCRREDIVIGTSYVECDFDMTAIDYKLGEKPDGQRYIYEADPLLLKLAEKDGSLKTGKLGTGDVFLTSREKKELFKKEFGVNAFDMESAAIASVCDKCDVPFLSVRKISDDADDAAAETYREMNKRQEACLTQVLAEIIDSLLDFDNIW
ncbi:MAG: 5'-methylthioadenosine/S-adenosylhomocysteine nucleosidase [Acutalibacteraceae bacterium]|nr:5'-methylthioadenosine/S-adenosylhomocysteine nucleosidase [Oscillospiraceae bacterium]